MPKSAWRNCYEVVSEYTDNEHLIQAVCGMWPAFGITPKKLSFLYAAILLNNQNPMSFPVGGSSRIAQTIIPVIQQSDGEVFTYALVEQVLFKDNRAIGVKMADGHEIFAPAIISTAGVFNTFNHLVPEAITRHFGYQDKLQTVKRTVAHFNLFVGFNDSNQNLQLHSGQLFSQGLDIEADTQAFEKDLQAELPFVFLSFPSAKDPDWDNRYPGKSTCSVIVYIKDFEHFKKWRHEQWEKRGADYDQLKEEIAQRILKLLYQHYPQLQGKVDYYELSTPLSTRYFCMYEQGEIYGLDHNEQRLKQTWLKPKTRIPGLYLAGQDVLSVAHTISVFSGALVASKVLGWRQSIKLWKSLW